MMSQSLPDLESARGLNKTVPVPRRHRVRGAVHAQQRGQRAQSGVALPSLGGDFVLRPEDGSLDGSAFTRSVDSLSGLASQAMHPGRTSLGERSTARSLSTSWESPYGVHEDERQREVETASFHAGASQSYLKRGAGQGIGLQGAGYRVPAQLLSLLQQLEEMVDVGDDVDRTALSSTLANTLERSYDVLDH